MTYPEVQAFETFFKSLMDHLHARLTDACPEFAVLQLANFLPFIPFPSFCFTKRRDQITFMNLDFQDDLKSFKRSDFLIYFFLNNFLGRCTHKNLTSPQNKKSQPTKHTNKNTLFLCKYLGDQMLKFFWLSDFEKKLIELPESKGKYHGRERQKIKFQCPAALCIAVSHPQEDPGPWISETAG